MYDNSGPGPLEDVIVGVPYRALRLQSDQAAQTVNVTSNGKPQTLYFAPGEQWVGKVVVNDAVVGLKGYIVTKT